MRTCPDCGGPLFAPFCAWCKIDAPTCALCGEPLDAESAEMYDPTRPDVDAVLCHGQCGLDRGLVVA